MTIVLTHFEKSIVDPGDKLITINAVMDNLLQSDQSEGWLRLIGGEKASLRMPCRGKPSLLEALQHQTWTFLPF